MSRLERQRRRRRNKGGPASVLFMMAGVITTLLVIGALSALGYVVSIATTGPSLSSLKPQEQGASSVVYAADGTRLGFIQYDILRTPISSKEIPQSMKDATVAIEDRRFFEHQGVDVEGIVRAAIKNIESRDDVQGGSTLTMQLIRNLYTGDRERTFKRKIREARLAEQLEDRHPGRQGKFWILNKYINSVPYGTLGGQTAIGVQAAARMFFDKPASALELHESALLAGLPQAPSRYNPVTSAPLAKARRDDVLRRMADEGYVTEEQAAEAIERPLDIKPGRFYTFRREGYFFDYVKQQLIEDYGLDRVRKGGLRIYTTLDLKFQQAARKALMKSVAGTDRSAAVVSIDQRTGQIKAMASSARYGEVKFNLAAQGHRQAGSTFKIMVLMAALRRGVDPRSTYYRSMPLNFNDPEYGPIKVKTYSNSYIGSANLVTATLKSDNSIYQQLDLDLGPESVRDTAYDMGIKTKLDAYPAEGLGGLRLGVSPLEMANAYATIASRGWRNKPTPFERVCFPEGGGKFKCDETRPKRVKVFDEAVTYEATDIMRKNVTGGTGTRANIGCPSAGKTGTTDDHTDAWYVGYTPRLTTAVWVGHANDRRTLGGGAAGGVVAAPIWHDFMMVAKGGFCGDFPKPTQPFESTPFFGKYSRTGVKGNRIDQNYTIDDGKAEELETGKKRKKYPSTLYEDEPQEAPTTTTPPASPTPGAQAPPGQAPQSGGTAPPPADGDSTTGAPPPP